MNAARALLTLFALAACSAPVVHDAAEADPHAAFRPRHGARARPDQPGEAMAWHALRLQDENGLIDPEGPARARAQREQLLAHLEATDTAGIGRLGWVERGPANIGGRTRSLLVDPTNRNRLWAGAVGGGIWQSLDAGTNWTRADDHLGSIAIGCLAMQPGNPQVLYAGTGEGFYNSDAIRGAGVLRSTDGGATWTRLAATAAWGYVNRIAVSPANPQLLVAATRLPGGIHRSTDGGATWTLVRAADTGMQVLFDPNDATKLVASVRDAGPTHRVIRSADGGATWADASGALGANPTTSGRIEVAFARSQPGVVFASANGFCWHSADGGANFTQRSTAAVNGYWWYDNCIWVDPTDANVVLIGGVEVHRSTDGGFTFTRITSGYINTTQPHPDTHALVADPGFDGVTNRRLYVCNDGGVYVTDNVYTASRTSGWTRKDLGYRASQFYGAAGDGASGRITGGTQDNGTLTLQQGTNQAVLTFGGDGGFSAIDWQAPSFLYGEYVYLQVHRSTNGGASAAYIFSGITDAGSGTTANFISPFVLDPSDPRRMYAGGASLWRTADARAATVAWSAVKPAIGSNISAIAVAPGNPDVIWVGHNNGRVFRTQDGTAAAPTWVAVDDNGAANPLPNRFITRIAIDRTNPARAFVTLGGHNGDNVWYTANDGATFADRTGTGITGLPDVPVFSICQHPQQPSWIFVGTDVGVFASEDGGFNWSTSNLGPAATRTDEVSFLHGTTTLLAATHGRGLWTCRVVQPQVLPLGSGCPAASPPFLSATLPRIGRDLQFTALGLPPGGFAALAIGFSTSQWNGQALPLDLGPAFGWQGCTLHTSVDLVSSGLANAAGLQTVLVPLPADPNALGGRLHAQAIGLDAAGNPRVSNAVTCVFGN